MSDPQEPAVDVNAIRAANRNRIFKAFGVFFAVWVALGIFILSRRAGDSANAIGNMIGGALFTFMFAALFPLVGTMMSKKKWEWGGVVLWTILSVGAIALIGK